MIAASRIPVIVAPMAGGPSTPELVAAVINAGGFGFLAGGLLGPDTLSRRITRCRELTGEQFGVNLFLPGRTSAADLAGYRRRMADEAERYATEPGSPEWDDDNYPAKLDLVIAERIPVVSFTFGRPDPADVRRLHEAGTEVMVTVTTPEEARLAAEIGADALCVQGFEAGGHRATFDDDPTSATGGEPYGLLAALRMIGAEVDLPLVAAGGIVHGRDVAAVLAAGAVAAQCGTAFLRAPEAGTPEPQRAALAEAGRPTNVTRAFSGRPARGVVNRFMIEHSAHAPAAYPQLHHLTRPIRSAANDAGDAESMSLWAGQTYPLATDLPAATVVHRLHEQAREALAAAQDRLA